MNYFRLLMGVCLLAGSMFAGAQPSVRVVGLFPNAALLNIDGQRTLVKAGKAGPQGVTVISADSRSAVLSIDGVQSTYTLTRDYGSGGFSAPEKRRLTISKGAAGHYWVTGLVNGYSVPFMVDTGATTIAMNAQQAQRLGIDFKSKGSPVMVNTASGTEKAWRVYLNSVKLGSIEVLGVDAMVLDGEFPRDVLLGMSFLSRVSWREDQGALIVEAKH
ncbi:retropepsin-like aspartic protease family protein [Denitrificimonas caeni]|uniref:retropepsin-like aspartic protease family protein n=1 Tax=Denitrificimonas caeni TaxID=521720 RepID=UPI00040E73E1|nr:TIGR02281 family clan AA aspartic protease [Denitrificimonas caeni]